MDDEEFFGGGPTKRQTFNATSWGDALSCGLLGLLKVKEACQFENLKNRPEFTRNGLYEFLGKTFFR